MSCPARCSSVPLPFLTLALSWLGPRRWLLTQAVAVVSLVFPLGTASVTSVLGPTGGHAHSVFSLNVASGNMGLDGIAAQIKAANPDLVFLQEAWNDTGQHLRDTASSPTIISFRWSAGGGQPPPAERRIHPPQIPHRGIPRSARWAALSGHFAGGPDGGGLLTATAVPREGFEERGHARRRDPFPAPDGRILSNTTAWEAVQSNAELRLAQVQGAAEDASRSKEPVIMAGDTNLPGLSWALGHHLGRFQDGFSEAGTAGVHLPGHQAALDAYRSDTLADGTSGSSRSRSSPSVCRITWPSSRTSSFDPIAEGRMHGGWFATIVAPIMKRTVPFSLAIQLVILLAGACSAAGAKGPGSSASMRPLKTADRCRVQRGPGQADPAGGDVPWVARTRVHGPHLLARHALQRKDRDQPTLHREEADPDCRGALASAASGRESTASTPARARIRNSSAARAPSRTCRAWASILLDGTDYHAPAPQYIVIDGLDLRGASGNIGFTGTGGDARTYGRRGRRTGCRRARTSPSTTTKSPSATTTC